VSLVSVVFPCCNDEKFIEDCLDSIARQTHDLLELVVVDDGSRDTTPALVERFVGSDTVRRRFDDRIIFEVLPRNQGAHHAFNHGIQLAHGDLISLCNADDRYPPDRIAIMTEAIENSTALLAFGAVRMIDATGRDVTTEDPIGRLFNYEQRNIGGYPSVGFALLNSNVTISTGNFLLRRSLLERNGGFRPFRYIHDWDFALRSMLVAEPLFIPSVTYEYRLHATNRFRTLGRVEREEGEQVFRTYFSAIRREEYENPIAPGPRTWPGVFEMWMKAMGRTALWEVTSRSPD